jgi:hypothetical protein
VLNCLVVEFSEKYALKVESQLNESINNERKERKDSASQTLEFLIETMQITIPQLDLKYLLSIFITGLANSIVS